MNDNIINIHNQNTGSVTGYVHSLQSMGAVDGPGIRFCVFLQGCPIRCMYCHNPDTWLVSRPDGILSETGENSDRLGTPYTPNELVTKILRYKPYFSNGGGVTVSGGEPLMQASFVTELFTLLHKEGIHTCLDTSGNYPKTLSDDFEAGSTGFNAADRLLNVTDLVICDIKFTTEKDYRLYTGGSLNKVRHFLDAVTRHSVPLWIRHVVVPGYTDSEAEVSEMARMAHSYPTLEKIELLPFHKLCLPKYEALGIPFKCADIPECSKATIERLNRLL